MFFRFFVDLIEVLGYQSIITSRAQGTPYTLQTMRRTVYKAFAWIGFGVPLCIANTVILFTAEGTITPWPSVDTVLRFCGLIPIWGLWVASYWYFRVCRRDILEERRTRRLS